MGRDYRINIGQETTLFLRYREGRQLKEQLMQNVPSFALLRMVSKVEPLERGIAPTTEKITPASNKAGVLQSAVFQFGFTLVIPSSLSVRILQLASGKNKSH